MFVALLAIEAVFSFFPGKMKHVRNDCHHSRVTLDFFNANNVFLVCPIEIVYWCKIWIC